MAARGPRSHTHNSHDHNHPTTRPDPAATTLPSRTHGTTHSSSSTAAAFVFAAGRACEGRSPPLQAPSLTGPCCPPAVTAPLLRHARHRRQRGVRTAHSLTRPMKRRCGGVEAGCQRSHAPAQMHAPCTHSLRQALVAPSPSGTPRPGAPTPAPMNVKWPASGQQLQPPPPPAPRPPPPTPNLRRPQFGRCPCQLPQPRLTGQAVHPHRPRSAKVNMIRSPAGTRHPAVSAAAHGRQPCPQQNQPGRGPDSYCWRGRGQENPLTLPAAQRQDPTKAQAEREADCSGTTTLTRRCHTPAVTPVGPATGCRRAGSHTSAHSSCGLSSALCRRPPPLQGRPGTGPACWPPHPSSVIRHGLPQPSPSAHRHHRCRCCRRCSFPGTQLLALAAAFALRCVSAALTMLPRDSTPIRQPLSSTTGSRRIFLVSRILSTAQHATAQHRVGREQGRAVRRRSVGGGGRCVELHGVREARTCVPLN